MSDPHQITLQQELNRQNLVLFALGRLDIGGAVVGGTGIVILAIILDRITQKIIPQDNIKSR